MSSPSITYQDLSPRDKNGPIKGPQYTSELTESSVTLGKREGGLALLQDLITLWNSSSQSQCSEPVTWDEGGPIGEQFGSSRGRRSRWIHVGTVRGGG